ncbi:MAG: maleylpyruvate isomerase family mycothiol-dependent enzyme [Acidimicrobiales bacterium]
MGEIADRYRRLSQAFADKIAAVPTEAWTRPSPCEGWNARDIVGHVVSSQGMFLGFVGGAASEGPSVADDPEGAWNAARASVQSRLDDPEAAAVEFDGFSGRSTFEAAVGRFLCMDLVVHGWDLARSAGLDETIDPEDLIRVREQAEAFGEMLRSPQAFGPALEAPPGASEQQRLIAFLGRRP